MRSEPCIRYGARVRCFNPQTAVSDLILCNLGLKEVFPWCRTCTGDWTNEIEKFYTDILI